MVKRSIKSSSPKADAAAAAAGNKRIKRNKEELEVRNIKLFRAAITQKQMAYKGPNTSFLQEFSDFFDLDPIADYQEFGTATNAVSDGWQAFAKQYREMEEPKPSKMVFAKEYVGGNSNHKTKSKTLSMAVRISEYMETLEKKPLPQPIAKGDSPSRPQRKTKTNEPSTKAPPSPTKSAPTIKPDVQKPQGDLFSSIWGFVKKTLAPWQMQE